jgi:hypothetical protein
MAGFANRGSDRLHAALTKLGFTRQRDSDAYRHNGVMFRPEPDWIALRSSEALLDVDPLQGLLGTPGPWKHITESDGSVRKHFELPRVALDSVVGADVDGEAETTCADWLWWALATDQGGIPAGWQPPERAEIDTWMSPASLTIQCGPIVRQGQLLYGPDKLALRFPILAGSPTGLSEARRLWLRDVLLEAQDRWRMVRIGLSETGADAEIDLTGVPPEMAESLFKTSLDALRWVVEWLALSAAFLADPRVECQAWEVRPLRAAPAERRDSP